MSVSSRLSLWVVVAAGAALFVYAVWLLRTEERQLVTAAQGEVRTLAGSVQVSIENALRDGQELDVAEVLDRVEALNADIDVLVVGRDGRFRSSNHALRALPPALGGVVDTALRTGSEAFNDGAQTMTSLAVAVPLFDAGTPLGVVVVVRGLHDVRDDLRRTRRAVATTAGGALLLLALVTVGMATFTVKRPLTTTMQAMREVRAGNLSTSVLVERDDELGAIAAEFNLLVQALRDSRKQVDDEQELRRRLEQSLLRADKLAAIGLLAAGIAHEVGTPLHIVAGRARTLQKKADDADDVRRIAAIIVEQSERITRTVQQLLDYARKPKPGGQTLIDLDEPVHAVLQLLEGEARRRGVSVVSTSEPGMPRVQANGDQMQQLALNLVRNALSASTHGGRIEIALSSSTMTAPGAQLPTSAVKLTVTDTGSGVRAQDLPHLFDAFFTTKDDGTGLGLAVVRSIVLEHGGTIEATSVEGEGATFIVHLPTAVGAPHV